MFRKQIRFITISGLSCVNRLPVAQMNILVANDDIGHPGVSLHLCKDSPVDCFKAAV